MEKLDEVWVGVDAGKGHHWACAVDIAGNTLLSKKIINGESEILTGLSEILSLPPKVNWVIDISSSPSSLLIALLVTHGQQPRYITGTLVKQMSRALGSENKTDANDAHVIARTSIFAADRLSAIKVPVQVISDLSLLTSHRTDLVRDRTRAYNRMRDTLTGVFPALERTFNFSAHKGAVVLLTGFQTPSGIRRMGRSRLAAWLAKRGVRLAHGVAESAIEAAEAQHTSLPGEDAAAEIVEDLAASILNLSERIAKVEKRMDKILAEHPHSHILLSMPGMGKILAAELLVAAGDFSAYATEGKFASAAGMVPVSRDSGTRTGVHLRPKRYSRPLQRALFLSAQASCLHHVRDREYYLRKRAQGMRNSAAIICVARRQIRMLWTLLEEGRTYQL
ncbi:IS110 family transposase (plasmid) [Streptomyces atratus]|uniref:IS110 family transposase n=1 Tax=Streptomyces atratus TaxID=1893 RepID=UPI002F915DCA